MSGIDGIQNKAELPPFHGELLRLKPEEREQVIAGLFQDPVAKPVLERGCDSYLAGVRGKLKGALSLRLEENYFSQEKENRLSASETASVVHTYMQARIAPKPSPDAMIGKSRALDVWQSVQDWELVDESSLAALAYSGKDAMDKSTDRFMNFITSDRSSVTENERTMLNEKVTVLVSSLLERRKLREEMK